MAQEGANPAETITETAAQIIEQARGAMENYVDFFEKSMHVTPWAETNLSKKSPKLYREKCCRYL